MTATNTRRLSGLISAGAHVRGGYGFGVNRNAPGIYAIAFLEPFEEAPVVVVTPGQEKRIATASATGAGATVTLADLHGTPIDTDFAFIVEPVA